jgi:hypothetical protein
VSSKKELRNEIERLAGQVRKFDAENEGRRVVALKSLADAAGTTVTLVTKDGVAVPATVANIEWGGSEHGLRELKVTVFPQLQQMIVS